LIYSVHQGIALIAEQASDSERAVLMGVVNDEFAAIGVGFGSSADLAAPARDSP
jgi:hypothetical protein